MNPLSKNYFANVLNTDPNKIEVKNGFIEVLDGATGFMMIKRNVFALLYRGKGI